MTELQKVIRGLKACTAQNENMLPDCGSCPYGGLDCTRESLCRLMADALKIIRSRTETKLTTPADLLAWGHGWEERWFIGDDEEPENISLEECVWIGGFVTLEDGGSQADVRSDFWREHYNRKYGVRVWRGDEPPTDEQRKAAAWNE